MIPDAPARRYARPGGRRLPADDHERGADPARLPGRVGRRRRAVRRRHRPGAARSGPTTAPASSTSTAASRPRASTSATSPRTRASATDEVDHLTNVDYVDRMAFVALRDDVMVGVARYDRWPLRSEAEVAFFVDDAPPGRGASPRCCSSTWPRRPGGRGSAPSPPPSCPPTRAWWRCSGEPGSRPAARSTTASSRSTSTCSPRPEAEAAIEARAQRAEAEAVRLLLAPRSVAVVGAGRERTGVGHAVLRNLLAHDFNGPVYPVNPRGRPRRPACGPTPPSATSRGPSTWRSSWCRRPRSPA